MIISTQTHQRNYWKKFPNTAKLPSEEFMVTDSAPNERLEKYTQSALFNPIQKFSYTTGKNSTDSSLIIDAMDILHEDNVDGICIVSSDSDYTGLAKRIREEGLFVMGIVKKTPEAFVRSCKFSLYRKSPDSEMRLKQSLLLKRISLSPHRKSPSSFQEDSRTIHKAYLISLNDEDGDVACTFKSGKISKIGSEPIPGPMAPIL